MKSQLFQLAPFILVEVFAYVFEIRLNIFELIKKGRSCKNLKPVKALDLNKCSKMSMKM